MILDVMEPDFSYISREYAQSDLHRTPGTYWVNEIFYSVQGEGRLSGTPMVFIRFAQCNLRCRVTSVGFDCDTEFASYRELTLESLLAEASAFHDGRGWVLLTGGEPGLQIDAPLLKALRDAGWKIAIETNGTIPLPDGIDWICVSPKTAEHTIRQRHADEVKYVRRKGMALPTPCVQAKHYSISPAFEPDGSVRREDLLWCLDLIKQHPETWSLTVQYHKLLGVR